MEHITSFFSNIKEKLTNPFFGTFILVMIFHHWELWYTLLNFNSYNSLEYKVNFIKNYANTHLSFGQIIFEVLYTVLYVVVGYIIIICTRSLVILIEHRVMPEITNKVISKNVVLREEYLNIEKDRNDYFNRYEEQRELVRKYSKDFDSLNDELNKKDTLITDYQKSINELQINIQTSDDSKNDLDSKLKASISKLQKQEDEILNLKLENVILNQEFNIYKILFQDLDERSNLTPSYIQNKIEQIKSENKWDDFLIFMQFNTGAINSMKGNIDIDMEMLGLTIAKNDNSNSYRPNSLASLIYKYYLKNNTE